MDNRNFVLLAPVVLALGACGGKEDGGGSTSSPSPPNAAVGDGCPSQREDGTSKVHLDSRFASMPDKTLLVAITLRDSLPPVPSCPGATSADEACAQRDSALMERETLNRRNLRCVLEQFGPPGSVGEMTALWYELPHHLSTGRPSAIGLEFGVPTLWSQVQRVAQHPLVERVDPFPGLVQNVDAAAAEPAPGCPSGTELPLPKLERAQSIRSRGRQPVVVEIRDEGVLPAVASCSTAEPCEAQRNSLAERAMLNRRHVTCVQRWLDASLREAPAGVSYSAVRGSFEPLPPFGQSASTLKAFGLGIDWAEAMELAKHPYVESIWSSPDLQFATATAGCPPDLQSPIHPTSCNPARESAEGKITPVAQARFRQSVGLEHIQISVAAGATICPLPLCPGRAEACPEREAIMARWKAENLESQRCVRGLIDALGGTSSPDVSWLVNWFDATLPGPQVEVLATHPHVLRIEPYESRASAN